MKKNKYDTSVVLLYLIGKEDVLPASFRKKIPYSTIATWRKTDFKSYLGHEFREIFLDHSEYLSLRQEYDRIYKLLKASAKAWLKIRELTFENLKDPGCDNKHRKIIVDAVGYMKKEIGLKKALKLFGISHTSYSVWADTARKNCNNSHISLCVKKYPHQLHLSEVDNIRKMLLSPKWQHWPIVSIAALGIRNENIVASTFSWYKYALLLNLGHGTVSRKKPTIGLQSERANEYLHLDSTYYYINETQRVCICFVMDNYSKMILGFSVAEALSFRLVKHALANALKIVALHPDQKHPFLVTDGGSENHNKEINEFISRVSDFQITKIRALKDIRFSNSPVEAIHKIMKGRYLRNARFDSLITLNDFLDKAVYDYNQLRPHYKHSPQTPYEVYFGKPPGFDIHERMKTSAKKRVIKNKKSACKTCGKFIKPGSCITSITC